MAGQTAALAPDVVPNPSHRRRLIARWVLAGPVALLLAILTMAAMPMWLPPGSAGVNHLAISVVVFPGLWALYVMYVLLEENLQRAAVVMTLLVLVNGVPVTMTVMKFVASMQADAAIQVQAEELKEDAERDAQSGDAT
ncbi:MAG: hypothetical protein AAGI24_17620 [Pseudomonadota bacterium]